MMIVDGRGQTETALLAGEMPCPDWSSPSRARCTGCRRTQILLPAALSVRLADTVEVIGTVLAAKAAGSGYRTIAAHMGRPLSTVRRWLRRVPETHAHWLYEQSVQHAFRLNPDILARPKHWPSPLGWSLNILAGAALAYQLGIDTQGYSTYGTVMIDEAFIQANSEYAGAGINALQEFGFQLLLAAPEDKVDLSRHLGSVTDIIKHPQANISGFVSSGRSPATATDIILR